MSSACELLASAVLQIFLMILYNIMCALENFSLINKKASGLPPSLLFYFCLFFCLNSTKGPVFKVWRSNVRECMSVGV